MAHIECRSSQPGIPSQWVVISGITDREVVTVREQLDGLLQQNNQVSTAVASAFVYATMLCPKANPSDLWHHVIYRHLLTAHGWSDQRWKRIAGFALERALVEIYEPRLLPRIRMKALSDREANERLHRLGIHEIRASKLDLFLEGYDGVEWITFGAAHVKTSIAERIQDDVPASQALMRKGLLSVVLTMDVKSFPPPHGDCINYGELGGRSQDIQKERLKRNYIEVAGQFDALFSFNLRTPPSPLRTASGKRIYTLSLNDEQPDEFVRFLITNWDTYAKSRAA